MKRFFVTKNANITDDKHGDDAKGFTSIADATLCAHGRGGSYIWDAEVGDWVIVKKAQSTGTHTQRATYSTLVAREMEALRSAGKLVYHSSLQTNGI